MVENQNTKKTIDKINNVEAIGVLSGLKMKLDNDETMIISPADKEELTDVLNYAIKSIEKDESMNLSAQERNAIAGFVEELNRLVIQITDLIHLYEDKIPNFKNLSSFTLEMKKEENESEARCLDGDFSVEVCGELPSYTDIEYDDYSGDIFVWFERYIKSKAHDSFIKNKTI